MELFRGIVKDHPDTPEAKMALLRLGVTLAALAEYGDGDGAYNREAIVVLNEYKNKYPEATELDYVNKLILRTRDIQAQRLMNIADFYRMNDRSEVTERYLGEVIRLYPDTKSAAYRDGQDLYSAAGSAGDRAEIAELRFLSDSGVPWQAADHAAAERWQISAADLRFRAQQ